MHSLDRKLDTLMRILRSEARNRQVRALLDSMSLERDNANWKTGVFIGAELLRYWPAEGLGFAKSTGGHEAFFHSACFAGGARREVRGNMQMESPAGMHACEFQQAAGGRARRQVDTAERCSCGGGSRAHQNVAGMCDFNATRHRADIASTPVHTASAKRDDPRPPTQKAGVEKSAVLGWGLHSELAGRWELGASNAERGYRPSHRCAHNVHIEAL